MGIEDRIDLNADRSPRGPVGVVGSITHNNDRAAAVVARDSEYAGLGIDIESVMAFQQAQELQQQILTDEDMNCEGVHLCGTEFFVTLAFSAKESLYKALYPSTKQYMDFHDLYIKRISATSLTLSLRRDLDSTWKQGADFEVFYAKYDTEIFTIAYL